ncbi:hypothetical protein IIC65_05665, partial [Candidatus Sumerlaeota bacterium]|nr:hypothetical protein [Candidatus Sumerlaeota bacterium]
MLVSNDYPSHPLADPREIERGIKSIVALPIKSQGKVMGVVNVVSEMRDIMKTLTIKNLAECYHDAEQRLSEAYTMFTLGYLDLEDKAKIETLYRKKLEGLEGKI